MLRELHISNLAVIDRVAIDFDEGLNCFTGQTGAGKSLILGAFECLLGMRSGADMLRSGSKEARVSGVFELRDPWVAEQVGTTISESLSTGDELLLTRRLTASGRSAIMVNGQPATASMVRALGQLLVDVHGQHDHQYLLKPSNQLTILDLFGRTYDLRQRFTRVLEAWRRSLKKQENLSVHRALRRQQQELYEFQAQEIDDIAPQPGEWAELQARHSVLTNLERLKRDVNQVHGALYETEGSVVERLQMMSHLLNELVDLDGQLGPVTEQVRNAMLSLQDGAFELSRYKDRLDVDPNERLEIDERLNGLNRLIAKYAEGRSATDPLALVLDHRAAIQQELERLSRENEDLSSIGVSVDALAQEIASLGAELHESREKAARKLRPLVESNLHELGMSDATFAIDIQTSAFEASTATATGFDTIEMMVRTNPGQPARPLRRIASGGEMSRIMLALKSVLAQADRVSVLVFDEIDANVGGRMGTVIGRKLRGLASGPPEGSAGQGEGKHQVMCITHLPQIAAFADRHIHIAKTVAGESKGRATRIVVTTLSGKTRVDELAEMLAGNEVTETTRRQARELLRSATDGTKQNTDVKPTRTSKGRKSRLKKKSDRTSPAKT